MFFLPFTLSPSLPFDQGRAYTQLKNALIQQIRPASLPKRRHLIVPRRDDGVRLGTLRQHRAEACDTG